MKNKLLILLFFLGITLNCYAADIVRYVNPGADAGGDGTTSALTGANCAYKSLAIWEAANDIDITGTGNSIVNCAGSTVDATKCTIAGWVMDATHYIEIIGDWDAATDLKYTTSKYHLVVPNLSGYDGMIDIGCEYSYVRIHNLQIYNSDVDTDGVAAIELPSIIGYADIRIYDNCLRGNDDPDWYDYGFWLQPAGATDTFVYIYNNWIYNWGDSNNSRGAFWINPDSANERIYIENNTLVDNTAGIVINDGNVVTLNNIVKGSGNTLAYIELGGTHTQDYNMTDGTDVTGQGANSHTEHTFSFVDEANGDFHLQSTDTGAINLATETVNSGYTTDIDNVARGANWDCGADQYVAGGGATPDTATVMMVN